MRMKEYRIKRLAELLFIGLPVICFFSCSNSDSDKESTNNYNNPSISVDVSVEGVVWSDETTITRANDEVKETVIPINDELEIVATFEPDYDVITKTRAALESLENGTAYRVIAYKQGGAGIAEQYVRHADFKVGTASAPNTPFLLPNGCTYDIVCYSNGTATLGTFDKESYEFTYATGGMPLYCKTTLVVPAEVDAVELPITFKHMDSMVKVTVKNATDYLTMTEVAGVKIGPHYNTMNLKLSDGHRIDSGGASSTQEVTMQALSGGIGDQCESIDYVSVFSHDGVLTTTPFINIQTIKLKNIQGTESIISDKILNGPANWINGCRYKATFTLKTTNGYTMTVLTSAPVDVSKYVKIELTNLSGGTTSTNPASSVTFTGPLGSYAKAGYKYGTGASPELNVLKHYLFAGWEMKKTSSSDWMGCSTANAIALEPSKEKNGYQYRALFLADNRTINYKWKLVGVDINGVSGKHEQEGEFTHQAFQPLDGFVSVQDNSHDSGSTYKYYTCIGSKFKNGWQTVYRSVDPAFVGWAFVCNDDEFVPFDDLPGTDTDLRTHEIRIYVNWAMYEQRDPESAAEWEDFDLWVHNMESEAGL